MARRFSPPRAFTRNSSVARSLKSWMLREKRRSEQIETDPQLLLIFPSIESSPRDLLNLKWYRWWLNQQLKSLPDEFFSILLESDQKHPLESSQVTEIYVRVAECLKDHFSPSIERTVNVLLADGILSPCKDESSTWLYQTLVFAIIGWQTMLYRPSFGTSPPNQFSVVNDYDGPSGQAFLAFKQDNDKAQRPLDEFLMGFGLLIPPQNTCLGEDDLDKEAFNSILTVDSRELNALLAFSTAHVQIRWVDSLAMHLEYDKLTNTLYLFRYPSFCAANIPQVFDDKLVKGVIHSCASQSAGDQQWISSDDITAFLREVLSSYRLLFGQSKEGRQYFRQTVHSQAFEDIPPEGQDPLLTILCGRKTIDFSAHGKDRTLYRLARDFPMLRCRIAVLKKLLDTSKPRGWKELWRDKRDSAQWVTFWAVIVIGGAGLLLSFMQVVLALLQLTLK